MNDERGTPRYPRARFSSYSTVREITPAPSGSSVAYISDLTGQMNAWCTSGKTASPRPLTAFTSHSVRQIVWTPDGDRLVLAADRGGDENTNLYLLDVKGGWPVPLTASPSARFLLGPGSASGDGLSVLCMANDRDPGWFDLIEVSLDGGATRRVYLPSTSMADLGGRSPDGTCVLLTLLASNTRTWVEEVNLSNGTSHPLAAAEGEARFIAQGYSPDGRFAYVLTDASTERLALARVDRKTGAREIVYSPDGDVERVAVHPDGRLLGLLVNQDARTRVVLLPLLPDGRPSPEVRYAQGAPQGLASELAFSSDGRALYAVIEDSLHPEAIYRMAVPSGRGRRLTDTWIGAIPKRDLIEPKLTQIASADGVTVPCLVYQPKGATKSSPVPALISIHGGPESEESASYAYGGLYQYLLNRGIAVFAPNLRGSTGFGKSYQKLIHRDWGGGDLRDLEAVADSITHVPWVDATKLGVFGGSYGGFVALSAVSRLPRFDWAAGVSICGPSDLVSFTRTVPPSWRPVMREWVGDPDDDADMLRARSPITYAEQVWTPLLILQGGNDPRVVKAESDNMVKRVRAAQTPVTYLVFPDEGHGLVQRENRDEAFRQIEKFLLQQLKGETPEQEDEEEGSAWA